MNRKQTKHRPKTANKSTGEPESKRVNSQELLGAPRQVTITKAEYERYERQHLRLDDSIMVTQRWASGKKKRGRPQIPETQAIIEAEALRLAQGREESEYQVAQRFFPGLSKPERYGRYKVIISQHAKKVQALLEKLQRH